MPLTWATSGTLQRAVGSFDVPYRLVETTTAGRIDIVGFRVDPGGSFPSLDHSTEVDVVGRQVQVGTYDEGRYVAARLTVSDGYFLTIEAHGRSVDDVLAVARTLRPMDEATWNAVPTGAEPLGDACFFLC